MIEKRRKKGECKKKKEREGGDLKKAIVLNGQQNRTERRGRRMEGDRRLYD